MSKYFNIEKGVLSFRRGHEMIRLEGWGDDALRVRTTENKSFISNSSKILRLLGPISISAVIYFL
jgi:hypothetical protein